MRDFYLLGAGFIVASVLWDVVFTRVEERWMRERHDLRQSIATQAAVLAQRPRSALPTDPVVIRDEIDDLLGHATAWEDDGWRATARRATAYDPGDPLMPRKLCDSHPEIDWDAVKRQARRRYEGGETFDAIATWIGLRTGYRPTRRTVSNWAHSEGWAGEAIGRDQAAPDPMQLVHAVPRCGWCDFTRPGRRCVACGSVAARVSA